MLKINKLTKYYGKTLGVKNLSLEVKKGEIFGFIGPNGAGKSTTIRCIMDMINKSSGSIYIDNTLVTRRNHKVLENVGYLPGEIHLYEDFKVSEMINYSKKFYHKDLDKRINYLVKKLKLDTTKKVEDLSLGNLKKLGIVLTLMHEPKLLILDEATSGLDPLIQEIFYELLLEEKNKGTTIFFSSHILSEVKRISDRIGIIKDGVLVKTISSDLIKEQKEYVITVSGNINKLKKSFEHIVNIDDNTIKFIYDGNINDLISNLSNYKLNKILIEEPSFEDLFMEYYK